jgi:UDP-N-acetylmuramoyl-L-alanyl-D-glutamate--2,6-diaminopimelate ligase
VNADDPASASMLAAAPRDVRRLRYGLRDDGDVTARDITFDGDGMNFIATFGREERPARTPLLGAFNVANCLAAVAVAVSQGAGLGDAVGALATFPGVPGRMEPVDAGQPFRVVVDIASTEQAMRNVLQVLRPATRRHLIVVFGAAGERDVERRAGIARAVAAGADYGIVANEDPRSEDPDAIIDDIARELAANGMREGVAFERCPDRREALARAFGRAAAGDTVLLAGKGTEQSIVIGTEHHAWDEATVAQELLGGERGV